MSNDPNTPSRSEDFRVAAWNEFYEANKGSEWVSRESFEAGRASLEAENQKLRDLIEKMREEWIHTWAKDECLAALAKESDDDEG